MAIITTRTNTGATVGTGTISSSLSSTTVTGVGTLFLSEVSLVGKALFTNADVYIGTVASITSNTSLTLTATGAVTTSGAVYKIGYQPKGTPLSTLEIDANFINLNNSKLEFSDSTAANIGNYLVRRDNSGNFAAGTIAAALSGNATTATTLQTVRKINNVNFDGSADIVVPTLFDADYSRITNPSGGRWVTAPSSVTGALAITLPSGPTNTMLHMTIKVYEYTTNKSFELHVGGYSYSVGNTWENNPFAYIVGNPNVDRRITVRFGYTAAGKMIVYIGEVDSVWSYPQVFVTEVLCGYGGQANTYTSGWSIGSVTAFENVTATVTNSQVGWTAQALQTANSYQVNSIGVGTAASGTAGDILATSQTLSGSGRANSLGVGTAASGVAGEIRATSQIVAYYSDGRLKKDLEVIENALSKVCSLTGYTYYANDTAAEFGYTTKEKHVGLIAQDVNKVQPEVVKPAPFDLAQREDGTEYSVSGKDYLTVQYEKLIPLLVEAIKELKVKVDKLEG